MAVNYLGKQGKIILTIAIPMLLFAKISVGMIEKKLSVFDDTVYQFVAKFMAEEMTDFMKVLTFLGSGLALVLITLSIFAGTYGKKKVAFWSWMAAVNLIVSSALNEILKLIFHRERPDILRLVNVSDYSFPSGHSMIGMCFYGFVAYMVYKNMRNGWKYAAVFLISILILLIGISRIYLGVHYASDVVGGFLAGLAWLAALIPIHNRMYKNYCDKHVQNCSDEE